MKLTERHIYKLLSVLVFTLVWVNGSWANCSIGFDLHHQAKNFSSFQEDTKDKPFLFDEITIGDASPTINQNENFGFGFLVAFLSRSEFLRIEISSSFRSTYYLKDQRKLIFQYLFPFHFFW